MIHSTIRCVKILLLVALLAVGTIVTPAIAANSDIEKQYNRLNEDIYRLFQNQEYEKAISTAKKTITFAEKNFGEESPLTIVTIFTLAQLYEALGRLEEAEQQLLLVVSLYEQSFDAGELDKVNAKESLASVYMAQGKFQKAEKLFLEALNTKKGLLGDIDPETALTMASLAELYRQMGLYGRADELFRDAIQIYQKLQGDQDPGLYTMLANQARLFENQGLFEQAEAAYTKVWQFDLKTLGEKHPNTIANLNNLAGIYRKQGLFRKAEKALKKVLSDYKSTFGDKNPETVVATNNLALLYENQGLYDQAEPLFKTALNLSKGVLGESHPRTLAIMNNLALLFESQGIFKKAEPLYINTIELNRKIKGAEHPDTIASLNNLAYLYLLQNEFNEAEKLFEDVLQIWEVQLGEQHQKTLKALNNLARVKRQLGRYEEAERMFKKALGLRRQTLGENHPDAIRSMIDTAGLYISQKKLSEAEEMNVEALQRAQNTLGDKHPYSLEALNQLASIYESSRKLDKALEIRTSGFEHRSEFFDRVLWVTGENARQSYITLHKPEQDAYIALLSKINKPETARLTLNVSLQRKGLLLKIASEIQKVVELADAPHLSGLANRLNKARKDFAALTLAGPSGETAEEFQKKLLKLENEIDDIQAKLGRASRMYQDTTRKIAVDEVLEALDENDVLIDFIAYKDKTDRMIAIVVQKDPQKKPRIDLVPLGRIVALRHAVSIYRTAIQDEGVELDELEETGKEVFDAVWKPLEPFLGKKSSIYLVPDSVLHLLPFDAMIDEDGKYLLETKDLKILSSARDLVVASLTPNNGELMIVAGPDYDIEYLKDEKKTILERRRRRASRGIAAGLRLASVGMRSLSFSRLRGAELEGKTIKTVSDRKNKASVMHTLKRAEEQRLRELKKAPLMLHIATHGFFLSTDESLIKRLLSLQRGATNRLPPPGDNPLLRAGLAFAGVNKNAPFLGDIDTDNDGVLTALEVLELKLIGTQLVVLSACETGVGEIHAGEGVYGLRRAFQEAGVNSVLNSLWPVSDEGTRRLMTGFYTRLLDGLPSRVALKKTQLALLKSEWDHPYYWAAFVMVAKKD